MIISKSLPYETANPPYTPYMWTNTTTGEVFVCIDNTKDKNVWIGQSGTSIGEGWSKDLFYDYVSGALSGLESYGPVDYTGTPIDTGLSNSVASLTILAKVTLSSIPAEGTGFVGSYYGTESYKQLGIRFYENAIRAYADNGSSFAEIASSVIPLLVGVEQTLLFCLDLVGHSFTLWGDGVKLFEGYTNSTQFWDLDPTSNIWIGKDGDNGSVPQFDGEILETRIYEDVRLDGILGLFN